MLGIETPKITTTASLPVLCLKYLGTTRLWIYLTAETGMIEQILQLLLKLQMEKHMKMTIGFT
jgi:hypothetical protein